MSVPSESRHASSTRPRPRDAMPAPPTVRGDSVKVVPAVRTAFSPDPSFSLAIPIITKSPRTTPCPRFDFIERTRRIEAAGPLPPGATMLPRDRSPASKRQQEDSLGQAS